MSANLAGFPPRYLRTPEASRFVGLSIRTLEKHRIYGLAPRYSKLGGRVVYRLEDLQSGVESGAEGVHLGPWRQRGAAGQAPPPPRPSRNPCIRAAEPAAMPPRHRTRSEREQLELFRALPGDLAPRDAQDLMAYPFFSLAKTHRTAPIDYRMNEIAIRVEAVPEHGMATIWDADVLIWAASQIVEARDAGVRTSRLMAATAARDPDLHRRGHQRPRLPPPEGPRSTACRSTTVATSLRHTSERRMHRFSWINEWTEHADAHGQTNGIDLIMPDWFYRAVLDNALVLTIDRAYFDPHGRGWSAGSTA